MSLILQHGGHNPAPGEGQGGQDAPDPSSGRAAPESTPEANAPAATGDMTPGGMTHVAGPSDGSLDSLLFTGWNAALLAVCAVLLAGYGLAAWRLRRSGRRPPRWAVLTTVLGLVVVFAAASSPLVYAVGRGSHLAFMARLELMMNVAPPLLLVGLSPVISPLLMAKENSASRLRPQVFAVGPVVWLCVMYAWHLPALHAFGMGSRAAVAAQLTSFVVAGVLFWLPLVGPVRVSGRMGVTGKLGYLAVAQVGAGALAALLIWYPGAIYAHGQTANLFGLSGLADQRLSGVVMMVVDMSVASTAAGWIFIKATAGGHRDLRRGESPVGEEEALWRST